MLRISLNAMISEVSCALCLHLHALHLPVHAAPSTAKRLDMRAAAVHPAFVGAGVARCVVVGAAAPPPAKLLMLSGSLKRGAGPETRPASNTGRSVSGCRVGAKPRLIFCALYRKWSMLSLPKVSLILKTAVPRLPTKVGYALRMVQTKRGAAPAVRQHAFPATPAALLKHIPDSCDFVLIGEASHGTHEFYRKRAELTKLLIQQREFNAVALEAGV